MTPLPLDQKRLAFLGDSITDGHTLPLLVEQSLAAAGLKPPKCTNVAVAGNRAGHMLARLERDVLPLRPDYLTLSAGVNDAAGKIPAENYERTVVAILDRLSDAGTEVILFTTTAVTGVRNDPMQPYLAAYNVTLRRLARDRGLRIAEILPTMRRGIDAGEVLLDQDGIHLAFAGYRVMAAAVLGCLGFPAVPVVDELRLGLMPGVIREWRIRGAPSGEPLTDSEAARLCPDDSWSMLTLPVPKVDGWWLDQERQRGFAVGLPDRFGPASLYHGHAEITSVGERQVCLNTGADLRTVWFNGGRAYQSPGDSGWHAGRERIPLTLRRGRNIILIETGACFFLSVTEDNRW